MEETQRMDTLPLLEGGVDALPRYTYYTFECFTPEQVKEINKKVKENTLQGEQPFSSARVSKIGNFFHIPCLSLMELIHPWLYQCQTINKKELGYDIYWDFHLEPLNYNVYGVGGEYEWHIDALEYGLEDIKLTCLLNLSEEPYEGGEFCMINRLEKIKFDSGMGIILHPLIAHRVTPVTKGERITLTYWGTGPAWR